MVRPTYLDGSREIKDKMEKRKKRKEKSNHCLNGIVRTVCVHSDTIFGAFSLFLSKVTGTSHRGLPLCLFPIMAVSYQAAGVRLEKKAKGRHCRSFRFKSKMNGWERRKMQKKKKKNTNLDWLVCDTET